MSRIREKHLWPSWRYSPDGNSAIFHGPQDVPEGWEDHPSKVFPAPDDAENNRASIIAALRERNVKFFMGAPTAKLAALLQDAE